MKKAILLLCCTAMVIGVFAYKFQGRRKVVKSPRRLESGSIKDSTDVYYRQWERIAALLQSQNPKSAAVLIDSVYSVAKAHDERIIMLKAEMYYLAVVNDTSENAAKNLIIVAEKRAREAAFPNQALWQSIAAQLYWNYYRNNRYKILQRTKISGNAPDDFEQWDAEKFFTKIAGLYRQSVAYADELKSIDIKGFAPVLTAGINTENRRPTLFDVLVFRALAYFENDEKDITQPAFAFVMDDATAFEQAGDFVNHKFKSLDSASTQWKALQLYQQALALHLKDEQTDALIDADLHRLQFVWLHSVVPEKDALYAKALQQIADKYQGSHIAALASYEIAELMYTSKGGEYERSESALGKSKKKVDYPKIVAALKQIIASYPNSEAAYKANGLLRSVEWKNLSFEAEKIVLPGEASKILVQYRNVGRAYIKVVRVNAEEYVGPGDSATYSRMFHERKPLLSYEVSLPGTGDYYAHTAELKIDPLKTGLYCIVISYRADFSDTANLASWQFIQVSGLSYLAQEAQRIFKVADRKTGEPVAGADVHYHWSRQGGVYVNTVTNADGFFTFEKANNLASDGTLIIVHNGDSLVEHFYCYHRERTVEKPVDQTFFFTDRAIYRPGQTIFFKGIMTQSDSDGRKASLLPNTQTEVALYDANDQKVATLKLKANDFGSFTGTFIAPEGMLTGEFTIKNESGETTIAIEEYKRPKFRVSFDTLKKSVALNEKIKLKGSAVAYSGNNIDGANVKYRVIRNTRWDNWWNYFSGNPGTPQMEITQGTTTTDKDGKFSIEFTAIPDQAIDKKTLPVFTYSVMVDVTDINGETHSGSQAVSAGYVSVKLTDNIAELARPKDLEKLLIRTETLDGEFVPGKVQLTISRLQEPKQFYRKRLWNAPDEFLMDEQTFRKHFPLDEYKEEGNYKNWPVAAVVYTGSTATNKVGNVVVPVSTWKQNGWYLIEISTRDKNGTPVTDKKYVQVWDKNNPGKTQEPILAMALSENVEPGEKALADVASVFGKCPATLQVGYPTGKETMEQVRFEGFPIAWQHKITEADRGGIGVYYTILKDNRIYSKEVRFNIPWSNRDLDLTWATHRDKLLPGAKETWTVTIKGAKKEKVAAELMAGLYDASLDEFRSQSWGLYNLNPINPTSFGWKTDIEKTESNGYANDLGKRLIPVVYRYPDLFVVGNRFGAGLYEVTDGTSYPRHMLLPRLEDEEHEGRSGGSLKRKVVYNAASPGANTLDAISSGIPASYGDAETYHWRTNEHGNLDESNTRDKIDGGIFPGAAKKDVPLRKNLQETAFFYPQLRTDAAGNVQFSFTMPEALTEWHFLAMAHTKKLASGVIEGTVKTQKSLMVFPNLPRFFRQGDELLISTKISNLGDKNEIGTASIELLDAATLQPLTTQFKVGRTEVPFTVGKGQSTTASWKIAVPENLINPVVVRISASAGAFTDGEENTLPVISNRMLVTESMPMWLNGDGEKTYSFDKLLHSDTSKTLAQHSLTLEYTSNPAWYAVLALPYLMEFPHECAEQTFNRYYANALAAHVANISPKVKQIFKKWQKENTGALLSKLDKNPELKSVLLQETPWVMEAKNETEQRHRIALLFETEKLAAGLHTAANKLKDMQLSSGGFPWFKGEQYEDGYITQYILTGIGRLKHLGVKITDDEINSIAASGLAFLDQRLKKFYEHLKANKADLSLQHIENEEVQYLYMRSFFKDIPIHDGCSEAFEYYKKQAATYQSSFNSYMRGMIALALFREGDKKTPSAIISSLKEKAHHNEEMGMYWKEGNSYFWYKAPVEEQALLIECFSEITKDITSIDAMKLWLLKQKQTQNWHTTKATADACYALLLNGSQWLTNEPEVIVTLGKEVLRSADVAKEKGIGYFKVRYDAGNLSPQMGNIKIAVKGNEHSASWGAMHWQYFENLDKISSAATSLVVKKKYYITRNGSRGTELVPVSERNVLKIGDKVTVRIEIIVDRDMDYVHLKDMRASCFEPINVISEYKYQGGLGYYESTKDASSNFFISHLAKGKYVFEYPVFVTHSGNFSGGIATLQCMYAPEFNSHSEGVKVHVL